MPPPTVSKPSSSSKLHHRYPKRSVKNHPTPISPNSLLLLLVVLLSLTKHHHTHSPKFYVAALTSSFLEEDLIKNDKKNNKKYQRQSKRLWRWRIQKNDWLDRVRAAMGLEEEDDEDVEQREKKKKKEQLAEGDEAPVRWESGNEEGVTIGAYIVMMVQKWKEMVFGTVFDVKPTKSLFTGITDAFTNIFVGYYNGVTIILTYPFVGNYNTTDIIGFVSDTVVGTASGVLMAGSGLAAGMYSLVSGVTGAFGSMRAEKSGMVWSEDEGKWGFFSLDVVKEELDGLLSRYDRNKDGEDQDDTNGLDSKNNDPAEEDNEENDDVLTRQQRQKRRNRKNRSSSSKPNLRHRVRDTTYYNNLGVPPTATSTEIRRAYYAMALHYHPDKHPADVNAAEKFRMLGEAYQTLMDEDAREMYDMYGTCYRSDSGGRGGRGESMKIDPYVFFATMFGSYLVEPYVGELAIGQTVGNLFDLGEEEEGHGRSGTGQGGQGGQGGGRTLKEKKERKRDGIWRQKRREVGIALNLRKRIGYYIEATQALDIKDETTKTEAGEVFRQSCRNEAEKIVQGDFGDVYLTAIGGALLSSANEYLGYQTSFFGFKGSAVRMTKIASLWYNHLFTTVQFSNVLRLSLGAYLHALHEKARDRNTPPAANDNSSSSSSNNSGHDKGTGRGGCHNNSSSSSSSSSKNPTVVLLMMQKMERKLHSVLALGWNMNMRDISSTVGAACSKLLAEPCSNEERRRRAEGLKILGEEFLAVGTGKTRTKTTTTTTTTTTNEHQEGGRAYDSQSQMMERIKNAFQASVRKDDGKKSTNEGGKSKKRRAAA